jgi:glycosyltransferase involved in cell wall biosynthesis
MSHLQDLKFSLIVPTINRDKELERLLISLIAQTYKNYELIIIDQNDDDRIEKLILKYEQKFHFGIKHIKTTIKGASHARNLGIKRCRGNIISFPDDDCEYDSLVLQQMYKLFLDPENYDIVTANFVDFSEIKILPEKITKLNKYNIWPLGYEFVIFLRRHVIDKIGLFDEALGVGARTPYGSGEGTDYLLRALQQNLKIVNCNTALVKHEKVDFSKNGIAKKAFRYSVGKRHVLDRHNYNYFFILLNIWYPLVKLLVNFYSKSKVKYFWYQFLGRFHFARKIEM